MEAISSLFHGPKKIKEPDPPPTRDNAANAAKLKEDEAQRRRLLASGYTDTMLTGPGGLAPGSERTGSRTLGGA